MRVVGEDIGVAGVGFASAQVGVQGPGLDRAVAVVRDSDGELPQGSEVGLDQVGPGRVGRGQALSTPFFCPSAGSARPCGRRDCPGSRRSGHRPGRAARIDLNTAREFAAPFLRRLTPRKVSSPTE